MKNATHFVAGPAGLSAYFVAHDCLLTVLPGYNSSDQCTGATENWKASSGRARSRPTLETPSDYGRHSRTSWADLSLLPRRLHQLSLLTTSPVIMPPRLTRFVGIPLDRLLLSTCQRTVNYPHLTSSLVLNCVGSSSPLRRSRANWILFLLFFSTNVLTFSFHS